MVKVSPDPGSLAYPVSQPEGVQRGLVGEILSRLEKKGLQLVACKLLQVRPAGGHEVCSCWPGHQGAAGRALLLPGWPEVTALPVGTPGQWACPGHRLDRSQQSSWLHLYDSTGLGAVSVCQQMIGSSDPGSSEPGTIRGDLALQVGGGQTSKGGVGS